MNGSSHSTSSEIFGKFNDMYKICIHLSWSINQKDNITVGKFSGTILHMHLVVSEDCKKLNAQNIQLLSKVRIDATTRVEMRIPVYAVNNDRLEGLKGILSDSLGEIPTTLTIFDPDKSETTLKLPDRLRVRPTDELITRVDNLFELPVTQFK